MSTLTTLHPISKKLETAELLPDYYSAGQHAVRYSSGKTYPLNNVQVFTGEIPAASGEALSELQTKIGTTG